MNPKNAYRIFHHDEILKVHKATLALLCEIGVFIEDESTSFLSDSHTLKHVRTEMWLPTYFQRTSLEAWQESSDKHVGVRIKEKLNWLLETKE